MQSTFRNVLLPGPVAQRSEQGTHNPLVGGSNPPRSTIFLLLIFTGRYESSDGVSHIRVHRRAFFGGRVRRNGGSSPLDWQNRSRVKSGVVASAMRVFSNDFGVKTF